MSCALLNVLQLMDGLIFDSWTRDRNVITIAFTNRVTVVELNFHIHSVVAPLSN